MKYRFLILLIHFGLFLVKGQTYNFTNYREENGLNQSYVYAISQSRQGLLTLSTGESISWFDGKQFSFLSAKTMGENMVIGHYIDSQGTTWMLHQQRGLTYVRNGEYFKFTDKGISELKVFQLAEDNKKNLWLATSGGIFRMGSDLKIVNVYQSQDKVVTCLAFDGHNHLIMGSGNGVTIGVASGDQLKEFDFSVLLKDVVIKQIVPADKSGSNYWILTEGSGIYGLTGRHGKYKLTAHLQSELKADDFSMTRIYSDRSNNLWVSVFGDGLRKVVFRENGLHDRYRVERLSTGNGLMSVNIQSIFQDSEGNMWFGTFGEGLIKKPVELFSFYGSNEGIKNFDVKKIIRDSEGNLWMGAGKGLGVLRKETGLYDFFDASNGFISDQVNSLFMDVKGILWIGTNENGIYKYYPKKNKFENYSKQKKLKHLTVNVIAKAGSQIMAGTTDGLYVFDQHDNLLEELNTGDGLFHNNVLNIFKDSKERLWICSHGTPPYFVKDQKVTSFKEIEGLYYFNINAVCEDAHGNIWIATEGDGVFKYDNEKFKQYTTNEGLFSNYCVGIETDRNASIWVSHRNGSSELKQTREKFVAFTTQKGLLFPNNNINAIFKDEENNLWFGTNQGIVMYDARSAANETAPPEIFISGIQLNNEYFLPGDVIEKKYNYYSVHIDYKAISLSDPGSIYYKYRLLDVDTTYKTTDMPYVDVPKLGDGKYTFEVIACNEITGLCSSKPVTITFTINKPVWKEIWFYGLVLLIIIILMNVIVALRTKALKKTQALLELKIEQKTYLLKCEKEAVEAIKVQLEHKNKDMTDSIYYAKNIQDSLLPPDELLSEVFHNNAFVLFKPKDIVSGDFYWCAGPEQNCDEPLHLAAVIDCTGHGVPGAFLSILANDFLKQSVTEKLSYPNQILDYLNESVSSHLNQQLSKSKSMDGMDIALIAIDYSKMKLYYAGANNPIYIFREMDGKVEEIIIKATKQAIGSVNEVILKYELQTIDLIEGDTIYLFSDGYADQFGGPKDKKITYKVFRGILKAAFYIPMQEQSKFIANNLEVWKNETEQTDDVCVMGIKI